MLIGGSGWSCIAAINTVNDEEVQVSPVNFLQKLLYQAILSRPSPYDRVVLVAHQKSNRHDCQVSAVYWRPSLRALMHLLSDHAQHSRHAGPADIHVQQTYLVFLRQKEGELGSNSAFAYSALARQHENFVFDRFEFVVDELDGRVDLEGAGRASGLIGTAGAGLLFASLLGLRTRAMLICVIGDFFLHNYNLMLK